METYFGSVPPGMGTLTFWNLSALGISISLHTVGFGLIGGILAAVLAFLTSDCATLHW